MRKRLETAILWCLRHEPGMRGPEICAVTGIWRSTIHIYLSQLEDRGLVRHVVQPHLTLPIDVHRYYVIEPQPGASHV